MTNYSEWKRIYWESGVWRRFSFEDFVKKAFEIVAKSKEKKQLTLFNNG